MVTNSVLSRISLFRAAGAVVLALTLSACDGDARPLLEAVEADDIDLATISIQPPSNAILPLFISPGDTLQFSLLGQTLTGGTVTVSPNNRRWSSTNTNVATVSDNGFVVAQNNGRAQIGVRVAGAVAQTIDVNVSDATLQTIERIDGNNGDSLLDACLPDTFTAVGDFGNNDIRALTDVQWSIDAASQTAGAEVFEGLSTPLGAISLVGRQSTNAVAVNDIVLTATVPADEDTGQLAVSASRSFQVRNTITGISITPADPVIVQVGGTRQLVASATFSDQAGSMSITEGAEWIVSLGNGAVSVGTVEGIPGLLSGLDDGTATVLAVCGNAMGQALVRVEDNSGSLSFNRSGTLVLDLSDGTFDELRVSTGTDFNGDEDRDVTDDADWFSSDNTVVTVDTLGDDRGTLTLLSEGEATITAEFGETSITINVRVEN